MIEEQLKFASLNGVKNLTLTINDLGGGSVQLVNQCVLHPATGKENEQQMKVRSALSKAIVIDGYAGEVDAKYSGLLSEYIDNAAKACSTLTSNMESASQELDNIASDDEAEDTDNHLTSLDNSDSL
jgi:hypothetical protein